MKDEENGDIVRDNGGEKIMERKYPVPFHHGLRLRGKDEVFNFLRDLKRECGSGSKFLKGIGDKGVEIIKRRTLRGVDIHGRKFQSYRKAYAKQKGSSTVTLSTTGSEFQGMLSHISHKQSGFKVIWFVEKKMYISGYGRRNNAYVIAEVHNFGMVTGRSKHSTLSPKRYRMPQREFFGFQEKEEQVLKQLALDNCLLFIRNYKIVRVI